jgi:hypothetical protein
METSENVRLGRTVNCCNDRAQKINNTVDRSSLRIVMASVYGNTKKKKEARKDEKQTSRLGPMEK